MCIILEIAMFVGGIYALATAKVPTIVIGGPKYQVEGPRARIVGALLLFPLPLAFMSGVALGLFFGEEAQVVVPVIDVLIILAFSVAALIVAYASRQPRLTTDSSGEMSKPCPTPRPSLPERRAAHWHTSSWERLELLRSSSSRWPLSARVRHYVSLMSTKLENATAPQQK